MDSVNLPFNVGWISGMPRSGTTWLSQIIASCPDVRMKFCPLFSYEFKNKLDEGSSLKEWEQLFKDVYDTSSEYLDQQHLRKDGLIPEFIERKDNPLNLFIKSVRFHNLTPHLLALKKDIRFVHIVRHPCAALFSWLNNPMEFPAHAIPENEWRSGGCRKNGSGEFWGFDDWKKVTQEALELAGKYPRRFLIIRYEDLVADTTNLTCELYRYFNLPFSRQTKDFIDSTHTRHDLHRRSVFKKPQKICSWEDELDPKIARECISEVIGTDLEQFINF